MVRKIPLLLLLVATCVHAQTLPAPSERDLKHSNVATIIRNAELFVAPNTESDKIQTVTEGHEIAITETSKGWVRVFANTDVEQNPDEMSVFGLDAKVVPASGWILDKGIVRKGQAEGDKIIFGAAIAAEADASGGHGRRQAAMEARLLYKRLWEYFPDSNYAAEAMWRSADIRWQLEREDSQARPSAHEREAYLRGQMNEEEMRRIEKKYPHTRWADLAAWDMLQNKVCGDWQGAVKCPLKEAELYRKYAEEHPDSPHAAQALYEAAWRLAAAGDMDSADGNAKRAAECRAQAEELAKQLQSNHPQSDYAARAATLVYKVEQAIPIYGSDRD